MSEPIYKVWKIDASQTSEVLKTSEVSASEVSASKVSTSEVWGIGHPALLQQPLLGVFASARCPARLILKAHDWAQSVKDSPLAVVSGFHSPAEQEVLAVLLRGTSPIVMVAARGLEGMRIPLAWREPIERQRLLLLSPFSAKIKRSTAALAEERNRLALALAAQVLVIHATPGGKTESAIAACLAQGKPVIALPDPHNQHLFAQGIQDFRSLRREAHDFGSLVSL